MIVGDAAGSVKKTARSGVATATTRRAREALAARGHQLQRVHELAKSCTFCQDK